MVDRHMEGAWAAAGAMEVDAEGAEGPGLSYLSPGTLPPPLPPFPREGVTPPRENVRGWEVGRGVLSDRNGYPRSCPGSCPVEVVRCKLPGREGGGWDVATLFCVIPLVTRGCHPPPDLFNLCPPPAVIAPPSSPLLSSVMSTCHQRGGSGSRYPQGGPPYQRAVGTHNRRPSSVYSDSMGGGGALIRSPRFWKVRKALAKRKSKRRKGRAWRRKGERPQPLRPSPRSVIPPHPTPSAHSLVRVSLLLWWFLSTGA